MAILYIFIASQQKPRDGISGLVLFPDKMWMEHCGNPGEGDRLCSEHFISKKKSNLNSPDYVPSVYPETLAKKSSCAANASSLACFERAQRHSTTSEMERLATEREEERNILFV